jgi:hypothetical protein
MDADLAVLLTRQLNLHSKPYYKAYNYKNKSLTKEGIKEEKKKTNKKKNGQKEK